MKNSILIITLLLSGLSLHAQSSTDTTIVVNGVCGMCKNTIEKAAKIEGVSFAEWNLESLELKLKFDPAIADLEKINDAVVASGYDTEFKTASDSSYYSLAPCCYYRDPNNSHKKQ
ncbi:heavy-metal-associated domain-containing protein [Croceimicrobium sp.]|uniref:heavy-metal-associated domain-containing protein n=1 Tax=Croceimicrobium sp. TaxID=2828340 RepID=UPI003BAB094C